VVVETDDAGVGESDAKDVAGEVAEHRLFAGAPGSDVDHPWDAPDRVWDDEVVAALLEQRAELAADQSAERLDRD